MLLITTHAIYFLTLIYLILLYFCINMEQDYPIYINVINAFGQK